MSGHFRSYSTARNLFSFLEFVGWVVVVGGVFVGMALSSSAGRYASDVQHILMFAIGGTGSLFGLFFVGAVQSWRASVDMAEYSQQALNVARNQLDISEQSLKLQSEATKSFANMGPVAARENAPGYQFSEDWVEQKVKTEGSLDETQEVELSSEEFDVEMSEPLDDPFARIEEKDGKFYFDAIPFLTRDAAMEYAKDLGVDSKLE